MKYWIYILRSINYNKIYIGFTNNIERRLCEHNSGKTIYTRKYRPWKLVYKEEALDRLNAREREKYYKSAAGRRRLKLFLNRVCPRSSAG